MLPRRILAVTALTLLTGGCVAGSGYWDARLDEMWRYQNYGCRDALAKSDREEAVLYCPSDMPLPPNGVWRGGAR
jgi:hypothetical protein